MFKRRKAFGGIVGRIVHGGMRGGIMTAIIVVALVLIVLGALIPVLWPMLQATQTDIDALNATGSVSTAFLQNMWPVALLVVGLGIVIAIILYALKRFGVLGSGGTKGGI